MNSSSEIEVIIPFELGVNEQQANMKIYWAMLDK